MVEAPYSTSEAEVACQVTVIAIDAEQNGIFGYRIVTGPVHGTLTGKGPVYQYTPDSGYRGKDSFQFAASDAGGEGPAGTVAITVGARAMADLLIKTQAIRLIPEAISTALTAWVRPSARRRLRGRRLAI